jgi:group I intron endonuclease
VNCGVYILESPNGAYIGSSKRIDRRLYEHRLFLRKGTHINPKLQSAFNKHGDLSGRVLLLCREEDLILYEQIAIDALRPRYNLSQIAGRVDHTPEVRSKISASRIGKRLPEETRRKMSASRLGKKRPPMSEATKAKLRAVALNRTPEQKAAAGNKNKGRKLSPDHIASLVATHKGKRRSEEWRAQMSKAAKNMDPEKRERISEAARLSLARRAKA